MAARKTDQDRAIEMALFASRELAAALRKAQSADSRRRMLALRWARAIHRHLSALLTEESAGLDAWSPLSDEERQYVFADDPPRDVLLARASDLIRRTAVDDAEGVIEEIERRIA